MRNGSASKSVAPFLRGHFYVNCPWPEKADIITTGKTTGTVYHDMGTQCASMKNNSRCTSFQTKNDYGVPVNAAAPSTRLPPVNGTSRNNLEFQWKQPTFEKWFFFGTRLRDDSVEVCDVYRDRIQVIQPVD